MKIYHPYILAIDLGKRKSVALLASRKRKILKKPWTFSRSFRDYQKLVEGLNPKDVLVGFEATAHYWLALHEFLTKKGFEVVVLNPLAVKSFRDTGIRGSKTDKLDAYLILRVLLFSDHIHPLKNLTESISELKNLSRWRGELAFSRASLITKLISILDQVFPEYEKILFPKKLASLRLLKKYSTPDEIASLPLPKLTKILAQASRKKEKAEKWAKDLKMEASQTIGQRIGINAFSLEMKIVIERINQTAKQIKLMEKEIERIFSCLPESKYLKSIPGKDNITGAVILSEIGDITKYIAKDGADNIVALAGLDAKLRQSGEYSGKTKMTKRGSPYLRCALYQSARVAYRYESMFKKIYEKQRAKHKPHMVCLGYVAKKLARIAYSVLVNKKTFDPQIYYQSSSID